MSVRETAVSPSVDPCFDKGYFRITQLRLPFRGHPVLVVDIEQQALNQQVSPRSACQDGFSRFPPADRDVVSVITNWPLALSGLWWQEKAFSFKDRLHQVRIYPCCCQVYRSFRRCVYGRLLHAFRISEASK